MKLLHKINRPISNLSLFVRALLIRTPERVRNNVPYVCQYASPGWAEMVLKDKQPLVRDPLWELSGARTIEEYERWAHAICGMACTAMILAFYNKGAFATVPLARDAAKVGVYKKEGEGISSMHYHEYATWVQKFGLKATVYTKLSFRSMNYLLARGDLIIASVNPNIRDYDTAPKNQVGGHLVLITGYNKKDRTVTFHNPSGFENNQTQQNHTMQLKVFLIYFAARGIAVRNATT